jgi:hypothetical protein
MIDGFLKSPKRLFPVIPVETGIQSFQYLANTLDSRLRGNGDFLQNHQLLRYIFPERRK